MKASENRIEVTKFRLFLAKAVFYLHLFCIVFFVFGWVLPRSLLPFHVVSIPLMILQWFLNNDQCILTQIQMKLEGNPVQTHEEGTFIKKLFKSVGLEFSRQQLMVIVYGLLLISGSISLIRLLN